MAEIARRNWREKVQNRESRLWKYQFRGRSREKSENLQLVRRGRARVGARRGQARRGRHPQPLQVSRQEPRHRAAQARRFADQVQAALFVQRQFPPRAASRLRRFPRDVLAHCRMYRLGSATHKIFTIICGFGIFVGFCGIQILWVFVAFKFCGFSGIFVGFCCFLWVFCGPRKPMKFLKITHKNP